MKKRLDTYSCSRAQKAKVRRIARRLVKMESEAQQLFDEMMSGEGNARVPMDGFVRLLGMKALESYCAVLRLAAAWEDVRMQDGDGNDLGRDPYDFRRFLFGDLAKKERKEEDD